MAIDGHADLLEALEQRDDVVALPPLAHFHRDRDLHALLDLLDHARGRSKSFRSAEPAPLLTIFFTGQPMLMSTMSTPSRLDDRGRVVHPIGIAAVDLDRHRPLVLVERQHLLACGRSCASAPRRR